MLLLQCAGFCAIDGFDLPQGVAVPFHGVVVGFQGFYSFQANPLDQIQPVLDDVSGLVLVVVLGLGVRVAFVKSKV
jgi:hypothetical protein